MVDALQEVSSASSVESVALVVPGGKGYGSLKTLPQDFVVEIRLRRVGKPKIVLIVFIVGFLAGEGVIREVMAFIPVCGALDFFFPLLIELAALSRESQLILILDVGIFVFLGPTHIIGFGEFEDLINHVVVVGFCWFVGAASPFLEQFANIWQRMAFQRLFGMEGAVDQFEVRYVRADFSVNAQGHRLSDILLYIVGVHHQVNQNLVVELLLDEIGFRLNRDLLDVVAGLRQQPGQHTSFKWVEFDDIGDQADDLADGTLGLHPFWDFLKDGFLDVLVVVVGAAGSKFLFTLQFKHVKIIWQGNVGGCQSAIDNHQLKDKHENIQTQIDIYINNSTFCRSG